METSNILRRHGLFDASVPRYTSYPPANHFQPDIGRRRQVEWLKTVEDGSSVSVYIHIPFCRRLCWFCACRTQGTSSLGPVEGYVASLMSEIARTRAHLPDDIRMSRLHLGGGTPTLLPPALVDELLSSVFGHFRRANEFEFSVEVDPTEASDETLAAFGGWNLTRASVGVQDFSEKVQTAIGREQSFEQTAMVIDKLRALGVRSMNIDLLYGLPWQTVASFANTLQRVSELSPDRLAIYGYAHVPWMSKRQILIPDHALPSPQTRYALAAMAREFWQSEGYETIGIDHFALPLDALAVAKANGALRRNFQGYTDDQAPTLIGFGASAISRFRAGYCQNAPATSAYQRLIRDGHLAGQKGIAMTEDDTLIAEVIERLVCDFRLDFSTLERRFPKDREKLKQIAAVLMDAFPDILERTGSVIEIPEQFQPIVRVVAHRLDAYVQDGKAHSAAI